MWIIRDLLKGFGYLLIVFATVKLLALLGVMIFGQGRELAWVLKQVKWALIFATAGIALTRIRQTYKPPDDQRHDIEQASGRREPADRVPDRVGRSSDRSVG